MKHIFDNGANALRLLYHHKCGNNRHPVYAFFINGGGNLKGTLLRQVATVCGEFAPTKVELLLFGEGSCLIQQVGRFIPLLGIRNLKRFKYFLHPCVA